MQNKNYIRFADENTVEVIALGSLDQGRAKGDRKAEAYKTKGPDGQEVEYMVEFPNLTYEEMLALNQSKAGSYNKTGKIPYTCLVDPHTLESMQDWSGGISAKTIMEAVKEHQKALEKEHGKGVSRRDLRELDEAETEAKAHLAEGEYSKAVKALDKATKHADAWPEELQKRVSACRESVLGAAKAKLDEISAMGATDAVQAKRELSKLRSKLYGTGLEDRVRDLFKELQDSGN